MNKTTTALIAAGALVAAPLATVAAAGPALADRGDTTKRGACGSGSYEYQVEREDREDGGGFDVSADLDRVGPGSTWTFVIRHDGKRVSKVTRTADGEGDVDVDIRRPNTAGKDVFTFRAKSGGQTCTATITRR